MWCQLMQDGWRIRKIGVVKLLNYDVFGSVQVFYFDILTAVGMSVKTNVIQNNT